MLLLSVSLSTSVCLLGCGSSAQAIIIRDPGLIWLLYSIPRVNTLITNDKRRRDSRIGGEYHVDFFGPGGELRAPIDEARRKPSKAPS